GRVVNEQDEPIYFANLVLLHQKDSSFVKGTSTNEDGTFLFKPISLGEYIIKATYVGHTSFSKALNLNQDTELSDIRLETNTQELEGVVVESSRPVLEKQAGKLVFHVANTSLSSLSSYEILKQTPGVLTIGEGIS